MPQESGGSRTAISGTNDDEVVPKRRLRPRVRDGAELVRPVRSPSQKSPAATLDAWPGSADYHRRGSHIESNVERVLECFMERSTDVAMNGQMSSLSEVVNDSAKRSGCVLDPRCGRFTVALLADGAT